MTGTGLEMLYNSSWVSISVSRNWRFPAKGTPWNWSGTNKDTKKTINKEDVTMDISPDVITNTSDDDWSFMVPRYLTADAVQCIVMLARSR